MVLWRILTLLCYQTRTTESLQLFQSMYSSAVIQPRIDFAWDTETHHKIILLKIMTLIDFQVVVVNVCPFMIGLVEAEHSLTHGTHKTLFYIITQKIQYFRWSCIIWMMELGLMELISQARGQLRPPCLETGGLRQGSEVPQSGVRKARYP